MMLKKTREALIDTIVGRIINYVSESDRTTRSIIHGVDQRIRVLEESLKKSVKLPAFAYGEGISSHKELPWIVGSGIVWLSPGESRQSFFYPEVSMRLTHLRCDPPFVMKDIRIGNVSVLVTAVREAKLSEMVNPFQKCFIELSYPLETP